MLFMDLTAQLQNQAAAMLHQQEKQEVPEIPEMPEKQEKMVPLDALTL